MSSPIQFEQGYRYRFGATANAVPFPKVEISTNYFLVG